MRNSSRRYGSGVMAVNIQPDARRVLVRDRTDIGVVVEEGKNFGVSNNVYCLGIYFPDTGEVRFYETGSVTTADTSG